MLSVSIRPATVDDSNILTSVAYEAKAHWGYPPALLETWSSDLCVTPDFIERNEVFCASLAGATVGFAAVCEHGGTCELEHLWVRPEAMGRGIGRLLLAEAARVAAARGVRTLRIVSDPNAVGFYERLGARVVCEVDSTPVGRRLPLLALDVCPPSGQVSLAWKSFRSYAIVLGASEVSMGEIKTHRTSASVDTIIGEIADDTRREDCLTLLGLMQRATGVEPEVWSSGVVGFGTFHYKSSSGQEGDWFPVGFASRKAAITVYLGLSLEESAGLLAKLGNYKTGKGCIYIKRLADVDLAVLEELVAESYAGIKQAYG